MATLQAAFGLNVFLQRRKKIIAVVWVRDAPQSGMPEDLLSKGSIYVLTQVFILCARVKLGTDCPVISMKETTCMHITTQI